MSASDAKQTMDFISKSVGLKTLTEGEALPPRNTLSGHVDSSKAATVGQSAFLGRPAASA